MGGASGCAVGVWLGVVMVGHLCDGCGVAFQAWKVSCEPDTTGRAEIIGMLADVMGDDVDGFASMLEDLHHMGGAL